MKTISYTSFARQLISLSIVVFALSLPLLTSACNKSSNETHGTIGQVVAGSKKVGESSDESAGPTAAATPVSAQPRAPKAVSGPSSASKGRRSKPATVQKTPKRPSRRAASKPKSGTTKASAAPERAPSGQGGEGGKKAGSEGKGASPAYAATAERHVDQRSGSCSDSGPGSAARPWCSIAPATRRAKPGERVLIHPGVYREAMLIRVSGSKGKPIVFEGIKGARVDGKGLKIPDYYGLISMEAQRHLVLRNLSVSNSSWFGMHIVKSSDIRIERCLVERTRHGGIITDDDSRQIKLLRNEVRYTNQAGERTAVHEAITLSNVHGFEAAYNHVHHCKEEGIDAKDGSTRGSIHHNRIHHVGVGVYLNHARHVKIYSNRIYSGRASAIQFSVGDAAEGMAAVTDNKVYRNQIWSVKWNGIEYWRDAEGAAKGGSLDRNTIINNVILDCGHAGIHVAHAKGTVIHNNIVAFNGQGGIRGSALGASTISHNLVHRSPGRVPGSDNITSDPQFISLKKRDFRLKPRSPAIDAGKKVGLSFKGKAPDIGAHER